MRQSVTMLQFFFFIQLKASLIPKASTNSGVTIPRRQQVMASMGWPLWSRASKAKLYVPRYENIVVSMLILMLPCGGFAQTSSPFP